MPPTVDEVEEGLADVEGGDTPPGCVPSTSPICGKRRGRCRLDAPPVGFDESDVHPVPSREDQGRCQPGGPGADDDGAAAGEGTGGGRVGQPRGRLREEKYGYY